MMGLPLRVRIAAQPSSTVTTNSFSSAGTTSRMVRIAVPVFSRLDTPLPLSIVKSMSM